MVQASGDENFHVESSFWSQASEEITFDPALYSEGFISGIRECDKFPLKVQGNVAVPAQLCSPT